MPAPRADRAKIAVLEWELFGIEPEPGTVAAAAVGMKRAFGVLGGGHASTDATIDDLPPLPPRLTQTPAD